MAGCKGQAGARDGQSTAAHRVLRVAEDSRHEESPSWLRRLGLVGLVAVAGGRMLLVFERADRAAILLVISWLGWLEAKTQRLSRRVICCVYSSIGEPQHARSRLTKPFCRQRLRQHFHPCEHLVQLLLRWARWGPRRIRMNVGILLGGMRPGSRGWLHPRTPCPSRAHTTRQRRSLDKLQAGLISALP